LEDGATGGIPRRFAHQCRREHPGALDTRQISVMRRAPHVADPAFRVARAQADDPRKESRERAGTRQTVIVHAQSEITVGAGRVGCEQAAIDVAHGLRVFRRAVAVAVLLALPRAIPERRREPEVSRRPGRRARARHGHAEQRVDALQREIGGVTGRGPPDVCARLEDNGGRIGGSARGQRGEVGGGALEIAAVQRIETDPQRVHGVGRPERRPWRRGHALQGQRDHREHRGRHLSEVRR
jgi:hypothetical protein